MKVSIVVIGLNKVHFSDMKTGDWGIIKDTGSCNNWKIVHKQCSDRVLCFEDTAIVAYPGISKGCSTDFCIELLPAGTEIKIIV
jgi:hypothetical protein